MAADDLVGAAIDELYGLDPEQFTDRRNALAAAARKSGAGEAAKAIAALRKPTRSAHALNQLVRSDPEAASRLAGLGDELRSAQEALDGAAMRELSTLRRGLVEELADQAFEAIEQSAPAPALREEVVSTLNAAVADGGVVDQLSSGTLLRPARWDGFGFASPPELSVVRSSPPSGRPTAQPDGRPPTKKSAKADKSIPTKSGSRAATTRAAESVAAAKARAKADEQRRRQARTEAQRAVKDSDSALAKAVKAEEELSTRVRILHEQLTDARHRLDEIRIDVRRAENRQRKAHQALDRLST